MLDMSIGEIINAVLIAILVSTTIYYAFQNKGMKDEMKKQRKLTMEAMQRSINPHLVVKDLIVDTNMVSGMSKEKEYFIRSYSPTVKLNLENIGLGHAIDVNVEANVVFEWILPNDHSVKKLFHYTNKQNPDKFPISIMTIPSGSSTQQVNLIISHSEPILESRNEGIEFKLSYSNVLGEKIQDDPIYTSSSNCQEQIDKVFPKYILGLYDEEVEVNI